MRLPVARLDRYQTAELVDGGVIIAFAMLDYPLHQQDRWHIVYRASGLVHQSSRQSKFTRPRGKNRLHEKGPRITTVQ